MVYAADCLYASRCSSDEEVKRRGGDPDTAWMGCLLEADFQDHVRSLIRGIAESSKESKRTARRWFRRG